MVLFALALAMAASVGDAGGRGPAARVVIPSPNPEWTQVNADDKGRAFVDRHSINVANGIVRYQGRVVFNHADENGAVEIFHAQEINCAAHTFRTMAFDVLAADGTIVTSLSTPGEPVKANTDSPSGAILKEFCR